MTTPIIPVPPVSNVITIQPVATTVPNREQGGGANPLSTLPQGTTVQGFVVNRDAQANPILRTPLGDLLITSAVFLKTGSEVIFRVDNSQLSLARIVTVDGLSPQDYSASSARSLTRDTITASGLQTAINTNSVAPTANAAAGNPNSATVLQAIVLQGTASAQAQVPSLLATTLAAVQSGPLPIVTQLALLRAGAPLKLTLLDLKLPPLPVGISNVPDSKNLSTLLTPPQPGALGAATPTASQSTAFPLAALPPTPPALAPVATPSANAPGVVPIPTSPSPTPPQATAPLASPVLKNAFAAIANNNLQSAMLPTPAALPGANPFPATTSTPLQPATPELAKPNAPNQIVATVIGHDADGANILHTPFASLKVYTPQPLPTGTTLLVRAEFTNAPPAQTNASQNAISTVISPTPPAQSLTVFTQVIAWLQANQPDVAQDVALRVPNISHQLANGLLNYIIGIRIGDISEIIGKRALRLLEISNPDLLVRLRQQVDQLQENFLDSRTSQWNALPIPLFFGGEVHAAKLFIYKEPPDESKTASGRGHGQRFILEVEMSELGPLQFDGFVRSLERGKSFDLMVRSNEPLSSDISNGIRDIFSNSMEATRMRGQVVFQPGQQHFVKPDAPSSPFSSTGSNTILA